jgi:hypothetical protein
MKLHYHTVRRISIALGLGQETIGIGSKRKEDEQRSKAIKVLDLLQHSVELGSMEALYTLAKVSLVCVYGFILLRSISDFRLVSANPIFPVRSQIGL